MTPALSSTCCLSTSNFYFNANRKKTEQLYLPTFLRILNLFTQTLKYNSLLGSDTMLENEKSIPITTTSGKAISHNELLDIATVDFKKSHVCFFFFFLL